MHVILVQIEFLGHLGIREGEAHEIQTQHPNPQRLMMASTDRGRQIVEASATGRAQGTLALGLGLVAPLFGHLSAFTIRTTDTLWPPEGTDGLNTFRVVDERLHVYHGASIAQDSSGNKCLRQGEQPA
jgi:hypothetical protein